MEIVAIIRLRP